MSPVKIQSQDSNASPEKLQVSSVEQSLLTSKPSDREPAWLFATKILSHTSDDDFHRQMKQVKLTKDHCSLLIQLPKNDCLCLKQTVALKLL